jgi:tripartite-type tricarboxylate transporter receptor subunit TctC
MSNSKVKPCAVVNSGRRDVLKIASALSVTIVLGTTTGYSAFAIAAGYPQKLIRLIHSFPAGSGTDNAGRLLAEHLSRRLGQPIVVDNRPGASGLVGAGFAAKAEPDGYTMLMAYTDLFSVNPVLFKRPGYDPLKDFDPITLIGFLPMALLGSPALSATTMPELIAYARNRKEPLTLGTWGVGSLPHLIGEMLHREAKLDINFIPYQGGAPSLVAVMAGQVDLAFINTPIATDNLRSGKNRVFAIGGERRWVDMPNIPTFREVGLPDVAAVIWHGLVVRAGGNKEIIDKLYAETSAILQDPEVRAKLVAIGYEPIDGRGPEQFRRFIAEDLERWGPIVRALELQVDR